MDDVKPDWDKRKAEWDQRVRMFGPKTAIFNICHKTQEEFDEITRVQREVIIPHFVNQLRPSDKCILDFGCGWGRWTAMLADLVKGYCAGVDPTPAILETARMGVQPEDEGRVGFSLYENGVIPFVDSQFDVVWACMVLSTIVDDPQDVMLKSTVREINRVLKPGGLMFLIDNTAGPAHRPVVRSRFSQSRTVAEYTEAFKEVAPLVELGHYIDLGEVNTIMAGRKC